MNVAIRIIQALLALFALNGVYGLAMQLFFLPLSHQRSSVWNITGTIITVLLLGFIVFLLQCYYEIRNENHPRLSSRGFLGIALTVASIATLIGVSIMIVVFLLAFMNI